MSWFLRISRFASAHMVKSQDLSNSCGMCSLAMVNFKMKKHIIAAGMVAGAEISQLPVIGGVVGLSIARSAIDDALRSEPEFYAAYDHYAHTVTDFEKRGAWMQYYPPILSDLRLGHWEFADVGDTGIAQALIDATRGGAPAVATVTWDDGGRHAVVVDETHNPFGTPYLCVCDPWDGELHVVAARPGARVGYDTSQHPVSVTFFGDRRSGDAVGYFDGEIVRRVSA